MFKVWAEAPCTYACVEERKCSSFTSSPPLRVSPWAAGEPRVSHAARGVSPTALHESRAPGRESQGPRRETRKALRESRGPSATPPLAPESPIAILK